jgi:Fe-S cluster biogenesis protein NfuA
MQQLQQNVLKVPAQIRPIFQRYGGMVKLIGLTPDQTINMCAFGAVQGHPQSPVTLQEGIEKFAASDLPTIRAVEAAA